MIFKRLSTKLTVMFGGLFSVALLVIALACYMAVVSYARTSVQKELQASASVYKRIWTDKSDSLLTNAALLSRDFGFKSALATKDNDTVASAFDNLQARLNSEIGLILGPDGNPVVGNTDALGQTVAGALRDRDGTDPQADSQDGPQTGIIAIDSHPYQVVAAPVMAPDRLGWVVFGSRLDEAEMKNLQGLSSIPIRASILTQSHGGLWQGPLDQTREYKPSSLSFFIDQSLVTHAASMVGSTHGTVIAVTTPLPNLDSHQKSVLLLSYPLSMALKAYQPLLTVLLSIGLFGLSMVVLASLYLARNLTRPIMALKDAAFALRDGKPGQVKITTQDEMADLASAFNDMAVSIEDRERDITRLAKTDIATDLPNRSAFEDHITLLRDKGGDAGTVVICIGIDRYTHIRAVWGVAYAHTLVSRLQDILARIFEKAFIARLSADTLGLVLSPCEADQALPLARAIAARLDKRIRVTDDQSLDVMVSQGIYHIAAGRPTADEMIERALIALDQARAGKTRIALFDPRIYSELADTLLLTDQLYAALASHALTVYYQPKYSYREGRITSAEALVRWNHPERGFVSPQRFVGIAEETGANPRPDPAGSGTLPGRPGAPEGRRFRPRHQHQLFRPPAKRRGLQRPYPGPVRHRSRQDLPGNHRNRRHRRPEDRPGRHQYLRGPQPRNFHRRFRHRPVVPGLSQADPGPRTEDRPLLHHGDRVGQARCPAGAFDHRPGPRPGHEGHRRRC